MPHESTLLCSLRDYEAEGLDGLCDGKSRFGNRNGRVGISELALIGRVVDGYANRSRPSEKTICDRIAVAFKEANAARELDGLTPLVMPSRETIRQEIHQLDLYHAHIALYGEGAARKKFAPLGGGCNYYDRCNE